MHEGMTQFQQDNKNTFTSLTDEFLFHLYLHRG